MKNLLNTSALLTLDDARRMLSGSGNFLVAADAKLLKQLPRGNWIGGTIPYFMAERGGVVSQDKVFVTELPEYVKSAKIATLDAAGLTEVYARIPANGFGVAILPATSPVHLSFAMNAPAYKQFASRPLVGWISGVHLGELGKSLPQVFNGKNGKATSTEAVVMYVDLPKDRVCDVGIINIFAQGRGETLEFLETGFGAKDVLVDGKPRNFAEFLLERKVDIKNPLVANYGGAMVNVSFQAIDEKAKTVQLYAPVFKGVEYKLAEAVPNYVERFLEQVPRNADEIAFSCNCILNFLYSGLEGKKTGEIQGPITFGEVAYQLLNQTLVYLTIQKL